MEWKDSISKVSQVLNGVHIFHRMTKQRPAIRSIEIIQKLKESQRNDYNEFQEETLTNGRNFSLVKEQDDKTNDRRHIIMEEIKDTVRVCFVIMLDIVISFWGE